ncbi:MAG: hypothetical protein HC806_06455 [Anaerolineae bacterium]|nr:hypothetical protein [Anaerolineae bacterium]
MEIAHQTKAVIGASAEAKVGFDHNPLTETSIIDLGAFQVHVMNTPGHTPEHISFLIVEPDGKTPSAIFSGGALIVGGAARTDLLGHDLSQPLVETVSITLFTKSYSSCRMSWKSSPHTAQAHSA